MWFEDLSEYTSFGHLISGTIIAVGWLENGKPYQKGEPSNDITEKLCLLSQIKDIYLAFCGRHECDFCQSYVGQVGSKTTFVAYHNQLYVCPDLITHYIDKHSYSPPAEFIEAVLVSTPEDTLEYLKKHIVKNPKRKAS